jgi:hypothetical protein
MTKALIMLISAASMLVLLAPVASASQGMARRGWQLGRPDEAHIMQRLEWAPRYGINEIQLSHGIMMNIDAINDSERVRRVVNDVVARAHAADPAIRVFVWAHELNYRPPDDSADVCLDPNGGGQALLQVRREAYRRALRACPEVDGVVLMFGSAPLEPWSATCGCAWCRNHTPAQKAQLVIEQVKSVVVGEFKKELMVRTFIHSPEQLRWIGEAVRATEGITVMPKCVPQDWEPYYPHDETIGRVGNKEQVIEFDLAGEYWGRGALPFCMPDELQYRLQYDRDHGAVGAVGRIEDVFGTPNEVNIFAFSRLMQNPDEEVDAIWRDWVTERYGLAPGSPGSARLIACLRRTFDIGRKMYYVKGFWVFDKSSEVPETGRVPRMLEGRSIALYDPAWKGVDAELKRPTDRTLDEIAQEKSEAIWLSDLSLADLEEARASLRPRDYEDLHQRLTHQRRCAEIWRWVADAIFRYQLCKRQPSGRQRALVEGDLRQLEALAARMEADYGPLAYPGNPRRIRALIADIRSEFGASQQAAANEPPLLLRGIEAESVGPRSAVITWESGAAGDTRVEYGTTLPAYGAETSAGSQMTRHHRVELTGLQPATRYYFRVKTRTADGREMVSGDFRFKTPAATAQGRKGT